MDFGIFWYIGGVMHIFHTKRPILYESKQHSFFTMNIHIYQMFSPYKSSFRRIYIFVADYEMKLIRFCLLGAVACFPNEVQRLAKYMKFGER